MSEQATANTITISNRFLDAWKKGVRIAGQQFFRCENCCATPAESVEKASSKWQLIPDWEKVEKTIGVLSHGEAVFLAAMCAFYNDEWGRKLLGKEADPCSIAAVLDDEKRAVIADLLISYRGW